MEVLRRLYKLVEKKRANQSYRNTTHSEKQDYSNHYCPIDTIKPERSKCSNNSQTSNEERFQSQNIQTRPRSIFEDRLK